MRQSVYALTLYETLEKCAQLQSVSNFMDADQNSICIKTLWWRVCDEITHANSDKIYSAWAYYNLVI